MKNKGIIFIIMSFIIYQSCSTTKKIDTSKTTKIGNTTFNYTHETFDSWSDEIVINNSIGSFCLIGDGSTELYEYILGTYAIKAKIINQDEEKDICLIVDTGSQGNVISSSVFKTFNSFFDKMFKFHNDFTYSPQIDSKDNGVIVPELITEGFKINNMLFQQVDVESFGWLDDGTPVDGFIGMRLLSELPLLFSARDKKLIFFNEDFAPKGREYFLNKKYPYVLEIPLCISNKEYMVKLDTGGNTTLIPNSLYRRLSKSIFGKVELRMSGFKRYMGLLDSLEVFGTLCKSIPVVSQKNYFMIGSDNYVMIGETVLRNFDIYLDYKNSKIYLNPIEYDFPKRSMLYVYTSGGGNRYGYFGLNINRDKYSHKLRVASLYYINNKKICPEIKLGDYVLSVNGINQKDFNLEDLQKYETIQLTLQHKKKIYNVNLNKQYVEGCLEY